MSTVCRSTQSPAAVGRMAWSIALLLPLGGLAAVEHTTAASIPADGPPAGQPEVWLCAGDRIMELLQPGAEWPFVKQHLTGIKLYVGQLSGNRRESQEQTIERLRPLVRWIRAHQLQVAVELGGCLDFSSMDETAGEWSARHELAALANFYAAGGRVDFLDLDGPIRRLLHPKNRRDGRQFDSIEEAADQLVDALKLHQAAHPETKYWLLTNFPNWGWRGDVSYHARGPQRQDYGDYDQVVRIVLEKLRVAEIPLDGVTVDNPYDYLVGEHFSVNLEDPKSVDWLARVRSYEDFVREQGLTFNLIVNSQRGGQESDERFFGETLRMVDTYRRAGGRPTRWFVQSWYPHPKQMLPETAEHSMTALVKAVIERVRGETDERGTDVTRRAATSPMGRILLQPVQGKMVVAARVPHLGGQSFALGIPETIGARERMILNFPDVDGKLTWTGPAEDGSVASQWTSEGEVHYHVRLVPGDDFVDIEMTVGNLSADTWRDVFAFNCLNPTGAPDFQDWKLERTYMSSHGRPLQMAKTRRVRGHMPTVGFYTHEQTPWGHESPFVRGFSATSPNRTDDSWIATISEDGKSHMAATSLDALFLFDNLDRCCIHSATSFGDIGPKEKSSTVARLYLAQGGLGEFLARFQADREALAARQVWARPRRPRLELEGLAAPEPGRLGVLGFRVQAPWMRGSIEQRFPETIHSSLGLHFIDHRRIDMPPLSMLAPFPTWEKDEANGEISYAHKDTSGLVFRGRARPYEDEVVLEFRIRNETGEKLHNISVQMCTNLGSSPDFNPKEDMTRTFTWVDGQWTSLAHTTPDLAGTGRHPWILMRVRGTDYRGPRENPDGWWVADQIADHGIAARVTRDGTRLAAVHWDSATMVMSNSRIPCLHAGPAGGVSLEPGQELVWRGTIYLMENDPDQLLRRLHAAREGHTARRQSGGRQQMLHQTAP